jgi:hypothetical protein
MPQFHLRARAQPDEVSVAIGGSGATATVWPPEHVRGVHGIRDLRLANALHFASALAEQLGTDVGIFDEGENVFFIEEPEPRLIYRRA